MKKYKIKSFFFLLSFIQAKIFEFFFANVRKLLNTFTKYEKIKKSTHFNFTKV